MAIFINGGDITGVEPAIFGQGAGVVTKVGINDLVPADLQLSRGVAVFRQALAFVIHDT